MTAIQTASINAASLADITAMRASLNAAIFGGQVMAYPTTLDFRITDDEWADTPGLYSIDRATFDMEFGFQTIAYKFNSTTYNGWLMLYHEAHGRDFACEASKPIIGQLLMAGFDVVAMNMPLLGRNSKPVVDLPKHGPTKIISHNSVALVTPTYGNGLRFFLEPAMATVTWLADHYGGHFAMMGLSGGGWTTTMVAALDAKVRYSFQVAGSLPLNIRLLRDVGDWEQTLPGIKEIASYEDLYVLGAVGGDRRRQLQMLTLHDECCFANDGETYRYAVRERALQLGGDWDFWLDDSHTDHAISPAAMTKLFTYFE